MNSDRITDGSDMTEVGPEETREGFVPREGSNLVFGGPWEYEDQTPPLVREAGGGLALSPVGLGEPSEALLSLQRSQEEARWSVIFRPNQSEVDVIRRAKANKGSPQV